jgi:iron complex outermembrane receptor protein
MKNFWLILVLVALCYRANAQNTDTVKRQSDTTKTALLPLKNAPVRIVAPFKKPAAEKQQINDLSEVNISSRYNKNYQVKELSKTLRLNTPLLHLSQNVQEIGKEVIADQGVFNMTDGITRNVSGVIRQEISNNLGPFIFMRGGLVSTLRNGVDVSPVYRGPVPEDAAIIERVEFIKGPSLFMNNIGDPAGTFNVVTKQPTGKNNYAANLMFGSYNFYRAAVDLDGLLEKSGRLQYRLNVMGMKSDSFVDYDFNDRFLVAPVLKYQLSEHSTVTAEYMYQRFSYGLMSPIVMTPNGFGTLPRKFTLSDPSVNPYQPTDQTAFLTYNYQFDPDWSLTVKGAFMQNDNSGAYLWLTGVNKSNPQVLLRNPKYDLTRSIVYSEQAYVNGKVSTGSINHQLLGGVDVNQKRFFADSYIEYDRQADGSLNFYPLDVNNPIYDIAIPNYADPNDVKNGNTQQSIDYASFYALDEVSLLNNQLRLTLGGRLTTAQAHNRVSGVITNSSNTEFTPRIGLSYSINRDLSLYYLSDKTFTPQAGTTAPLSDGTPGRAVKPKTGMLYEAGLKKEWLNGKWNSTLSVYSVKRAGVLSADPNNTSYAVQIGESKAQGIDLDIKGRIVRGLNVVINYAYTDSRITNDVDKTLIGVRTPLFVKHIQNTWLSYDLPWRSLEGFGISMGYQYQGGRSGRYAVVTPYAIPDYFKVDGGLRWANKKVNFNMIINNIFNKNLIGTPWLRNGLYYWIPQAPTNFRLSAGYCF